MYRIFVALMHRFVKSNEINMAGQTRVRCQSPVNDVPPSYALLVLLNVMYWDLSCFFNTEKCFPVCPSVLKRFKNAMNIVIVKLL